MGITKRTHIKQEQKVKKRKRRAKLSKAGKKPGEYFYNGIYVGKSA